LYQKDDSNKIKIALIYFLKQSLHSNYWRF